MTSLIPGIGGTGDHSTEPKRVDAIASPIRRRQAEARCADRDDHVLVPSGRPGVTDHRVQGGFHFGQRGRGTKRGGYVSHRDSNPLIPESCA